MSDKFILSLRHYCYTVFFSKSRGNIFFQIANFVFHAIFEIDLKFNIFKIPFSLLKFQFSNCLLKDKTTVKQTKIGCSLVVRGLYLKNRHVLKTEAIFLILCIYGSGCPPECYVAKSKC